MGGGGLNRFGRFSWGQWHQGVTEVVALEERSHDYKILRRHSRESTSPQSTLEIRMVVCDHMEETGRISRPAGR